MPLGRESRSRALEQDAGSKSPQVMNKMRDSSGGGDERAARLGAARWEGAVKGRMGLGPTPSHGNRKGEELVAPRPRLEWMRRPVRRAERGETAALSRRRRLDT